jgi:hypothetical protein
VAIVSLLFLLKDIIKLRRQNPTQIEQNYTHLAPRNIE